MKRTLYARRRVIFDHHQERTRTLGHDLPLCRGTPNNVSFWQPPPSGVLFTVCTRSGVSLRTYFVNTRLTSGINLVSISAVLWKAGRR